MNDAVSSQGVHHTSNEADPQGFLIGSANTRRVEPRNTPSVINAVFNHRQLWDERAENVFNGINHLGERDPDAKVFRAAFRTTEHLPLADSQNRYSQALAEANAQTRSSRRRSMPKLNRAVQIAAVILPEFASPCSSPN